MGRYEQRDRSGPMDLDQPYDPSERISHFALPAADEGPSRKRAHVDLTSPARTFATPKPLQFGTNTPFIFHSSVPPPQPNFNYHPGQWASQDYVFGFGGKGSKAPGGQMAEELDVEMRFGDSPSRQGGPSSHVSAKNPAGSSNVDPTGEPSSSDTADQLRNDSFQNPSGAGKDGEQIEGEERKFSMGAVGRVRRKRQQQWRRRRGSESDREPSTTVGHPIKSEHHYNLHMPIPALSHSEIPSILLAYLQFFVNAAIVLFCLFLAVQFVLTVRRDVKDRMREHSVVQLQEVAECTNLYLTNRCDPSLRVPAMEAACRAWEMCMNRDPTVVGRIDVVAETFAGVINSFVDPISWKTMAFTLVTLSFVTILTNSALFNLRSNVKPQHQPPPQHSMYPTPPQQYLQQHQYQSYPYNPAGIPAQAYPHASQQAGALAAGPGQSPHPIVGDASIGWKKEKKGWW